MVLGTGYSNALTDWEEEMLVMSFNFMAEAGYPLGRVHLAKMVRQYCDSANRATPFRRNGNRPGPKWIANFEDRHRGSLRLRQTEYLSRVRSVAMRKQNMDLYFNKLEALYERHPIWKRLRYLIFNLDETCLHCDRTDCRVYVGVEKKNAYKIVADGTKLAFTLLVCCNAAGDHLPPFVLYKAKTLDKSWMEGGVEGACYGVSKSGWMFDINFEGWIRGIFVPYVQQNCDGNPVLLTYDGHNSHITHNTICLARDNNITILCLPPNSSHACQPLDVGVFKAMKVLWKGILEKFYQHPNNKVTKQVLPSLVNQLWEQLKDENAVAGFRKSGMFPCSRGMVEDKVTKDPMDLSNPSSGKGYHLARSAAEKNWHKRSVMS